MIGEQQEPKVHQHNKIRLWRWMLKYCSFVYKYPYVPILTTVVAVIALTLWVTLVYGIHPYVNTNYYRWNGHEITDKWDAYLGASKNTYGSLLGLFGATIPMPKQFQMTQMGAMIYERVGSDTNILEAEALKEIWLFEERMHATPGWEKYCLRIPMDQMPEFMQNLVYQILELFKDMLSALEPDTYCIDFKSLITELREEMKTLPEYQTSPPRPENLTDEFIKSYILNETRQGRVVGTFFGSDWDNTTFYTSRLRSMFPFALPIEGYRNKMDRQKEQTDKLGLWQKKMLEPLDEMQKTKPKGVSPYQGFPFAMIYFIADLILKQVWWLVGSFGFLFVFSVFAMRTFFVAILGTLGVFLPIPCALACLNGIFHIEHVDAIDVIALFLICGIGADCVFIVFELFRQSKTIYPRNYKKRLTYAAQRGLIALATSISTSAVSFLALCISGVRIMSFFGVFSFLLLFFTFVFTFTYYLGIIAIWAEHFEKKREIKERQMSLALESVNGEPLVQDAFMFTETTTTSTNESSSQDTPDYPYHGVFDFLRRRPIFRVDSAGLEIEKYNKYEKFFYNFVSPVIYFYRLPIVILFLIWSAVFAYFTFQMPTKSELQFLPDDHPLQRAFSLVLDGFQTSLNDFSLVYVWGIEPKPKVSFSQRLTIEDYGDTVFRPFDITDPKIQAHINWTDQLILSQPWIDAINSEQLGVNPWNIWQNIIDMDQYITKDPIIKWVVDYIFKTVNLTEPPSGFPITPEQYAVYGWAWQALLSQIPFSEPDPYILGTLKADTIGFSMDNYSLMYIGLKRNMRIPPKITRESLRELYTKAKDLEDYIELTAREKSGIDFPGFSTAVAWLTMVTEEELPRQVVKDVGLAFGCGAIVILISTWSVMYTFFVLYSMVCTIFLIMGSLYFTGWKIGTNEAIMISIASGFCADFIIQPMLALAHDFSCRSLYGKIQASLTTFCTPVSCALVTTLVAACFLYPCEILLFPPFATFLLGSGIFGMIQGFFVLPALTALMSFNKKSPLPFKITAKVPNDPLFTKDDSTDENMRGFEIPADQDQ